MSIRLNPFNRWLGQVLPSIISNKSAGFSSTSNSMRTEFWKGEHSLPKKTMPSDRVIPLSFSSNNQSFKPNKFLLAAFPVLFLQLQREDVKDDKEIVREIRECLSRKPTPNEYDYDGDPIWNPDEIANAYIQIGYCKTVEQAKSISDPTLRSTVLIDIIKVLLGCSIDRALEALEAIPVKSKRDEAAEMIREHFKKVRMPCPLDLPATSTKKD
jgi:hypothetical protein